MPGGARVIRSCVNESGIEIKPVYAPADAPPPPEPPGEPPFTRGIYPDMYRGRAWTIRQYAGFASAEESNARYRYLLERGQAGLSVAFDLPAARPDSDDPRAEERVGRRWRSLWRTCSCCSTGSRSTGCPPR
jgi:methylmalonyl-CoA mutase N-terminal domain/subunit